MSVCLLCGSPPCVGCSLVLWKSPLCGGRSPVGRSLVGPFPCWVPFVPRGIYSLDVSHLCSRFRIACLARSLTLVCGSQLKMAARGRVRVRHHRTNVGRVQPPPQILLYFVGRGSISSVAGCTKRESQSLGWGCELYAYITKTYTSAPDAFGASPVPLRYPFEHGIKAVGVGIPRMQFKVRG